MLDKDFGGDLCLWSELFCHISYSSTLVMSWWVPNQSATCETMQLVAKVREAKDDLRKSGRSQPKGTHLLSAVTAS